eukprot:PhF_6_TR28258/c0_g1_i1/m.41788
MFRRVMLCLRSPAATTANVGPDAPALRPMKKLFVNPHDPSSYQPLLRDLRTAPNTYKGLATFLNAPYRPSSIAAVVQDVLDAGVPQLQPSDIVLALENCRHGDTEADKIWRILYTSSSPQHSHSEDAILLYMSKTKDAIESVNALRTLMKIAPHMCTGEVFASAIARCAQCDDPFTTAAQVMEWYPDVPTPSMWSSLCLSIRSLQELKFVIQGVEECGVPMSSDLLSMMLFGCSRCEDYPQRLDIATSLYRRCRDDLRIEPTIEILDALMCTAASVGDVQRQHQHFLEAQSLFGKDGLTPLSYQSHVRALAKAGYGNDAVETLHVVLHNKIPVSVDTCNFVMSNLQGDASVLATQNVLREMKQNDLPIYTKSTCLAVLQSYATAPRKYQPLQLAIEFLEEAHKQSSGEWDVTKDRQILLSLSRLMETLPRPHGMSSWETLWARNLQQLISDMTGIIFTELPIVMVHQHFHQFDRPLLVSHTVVQEDCDDVVFGAENLFPRHDVVIVPFSVVARLARLERQSSGKQALQVLERFNADKKCIFLSLEAQCTLLSEAPSLPHTIANLRNLKSIVAVLGSVISRNSKSRRCSILSSSESMRRLVETAKINC